MRVHPNLLETVEHLPAESVLILEDVSWEEYEQLLEEIPEGHPTRITYDCGRLEVVTLSRRDEWRKDFLFGLVLILCEELKLPMEPFGSTTWKLKRLSKGAEPDTCFYIVSASRIAYKDRDSNVDLEVDPPPDLVVEIDVSSQSDRKFGIYGAFRVPEIWRLKTGRMEFHELQGQSYVETPVSRSFPFLTSAVVTRFMKRAHKEGPMPALIEFRRWVRTHGGG